MKKFICILLVAFSLTTVAQETINEGVISSKMTMSSSNAEVQGQFDMIGDILSTTYFKDDKSRAEVKSMMTGEATSIINNTTKQVLEYRNNPMSGGKTYAENTFETTKEDLKGITVVKTNETKTLLGYECTKYEVSVEQQGATINMDIFSTNKITAVNKRTTGFGKEFQGFPLLMVVKMNQMGVDMTMTMEVTQVEKKAVSMDKFDMTPPKGYTKVQGFQGL
ncbi:MAG: DUF4412 domain-containing protein [Oceanihabitans sp.]